MKIKRGTRLIFSLFFVLIFLCCPVLAQDDNTDQKQTDSLPASYDLRNVNGKSYVTPVKNQGQFGTCWAHAALAASESNTILKGGSSDIDLSEKALAWYAYHLQGPPEATDEELEGLYSQKFSYANPPEGYDQLSNIYNLGATQFIVASQMSTWLGASTEASIPYQNDKGDMTIYKGQEVPSVLGDWTLDYYDIYQNAYHLQNMQTVAGPGQIGISVDTYVPKVKQLLLEYGALYSNCYYLENGSDNNYFNDETNAQYIPPEVHQYNHGVTLVGWDDNYSKSNFKITPPGDGAWIVKNSYGTGWGDNGYFYLSYYDGSQNNISAMDVETPELGYSYDNNYQYDYLGNKLNPLSYILFDWVDKLGENSSKYYDQYAFANVFTAQGNEQLKAVSATSIVPNCHATAQIYLLNDNYTSPVDGTLVETVEKTLPDQGFYTLELENPISLQPGQKFSIVEKTYYEQAGSGTQNTSYMPYLNIEYGLKNDFFVPLKDDEGQEIGVSVQFARSRVEPGQSYVYGIGNDISTFSNTWNDVTNPETLNALSFPTEDPDDPGNSLEPGHSMIKAYTTNYSPGTTEPTGITMDSSPIYLTTNITGTNSTQVSASVIPTNATTEISYSVTPSSIASVETVNGEAVVTAVSEGRATLTAKTSNGYIATREIIVSDEAAVLDDVTVDYSNQDYLSFTLENLRANPAQDFNTNINNVSIFVWSQNDLSDLQAVSAEQVPGTNNWSTDQIGINNTKKYLVNANQIKYIVYTRLDNQNLNMIFTGYSSWVMPGLEEQGNVSYIAYNQNVGFVEPTLHSGTAGLINNPDSVHMEGLRVSSGIPGTAITTTVHAADIGWLDPVSDGAYAGTMHQNRALEAVILNFDDPMNQNKLSYRVYIKDSGWTNWVGSGEVAGTTGKAQPIQAIEIQIVSNQ